VKRLLAVVRPRHSASRAFVVTAVVAVLVTALVAAVGVLRSGDDRTTVTAQFSRAVGLYPGSEVRILGIPVGEVLEVRPTGQTVTVVLEYDSEYRVPADAKAAVVAPSLVSDRYVQLLPVYSGGPALRDGDVIAPDRTAVPVELDRITGSLDDLMVALGPEGANSDGALTRLLRTGAANLDGQGDKLNQTTSDVADAVETLSGNRQDLFETVRGLQQFTTTLAENDDEVRELNTNLASVADQLAGERDDLAAALANLSVALQEVSTFVSDNRKVLGEDLKALEDVTASVVNQQEALAEALENAPVALSNLQRSYNPASGTLDTRDNVDQLHDPGLFLCSLVSGAVSNRAPSKSSVCDQMLPLLGALTAPDISGLPLGQLSRIPDVDGPDPTLAGVLERRRP
jgi:phospholipid/cholesterol/gamma-HCH transport system substrate-binding protein